MSAEGCGYEVPYGTLPWTVAELNAFAREEERRRALFAAGVRRVRARQIVVSVVPYNEVR